MTEDERRKIEDLFARYSRGVASFVLARVGSADAAEEITSRVFLRVVRKVSQCRRSPAGWLWAVVRTELALYFRSRRGAQPPDAEAPHAALRRAQGDLAEQREEQLRMRDALARLPDEHQQIIYMKFYQDMPNTEIARATGRTPSNVGVLVHRSLKRLRALMDPAAARGAAK